MSLSDQQGPGKILPPHRIEGLVNGGAGLLREQQRVVFVPHTAAGDIVRCRIVKEKKNFAEARLTELVTPGPGRRPPRCPVAGICGGCQWQHLVYSEQLLWKERLFRETLVRQCGVDTERILPIVPAGSEWNYRSRVQIKCHNTESGFVTGFYRPQSRFVVPVQECPIIAPELNSLLALLRDLFNGTSFANRVPQIDLAVDDNCKCSIVVHYLGPDIHGMERFLTSADLPADLLLQTGSKDSLRVLQGDGLMTIRVDALHLQYMTGGFAQINLDQNRSLVDAVLMLTEWTGRERLLDLFCGMGNFPLPLARLVGHAVGIEESVVSVKMARLNAERNQNSNVVFHSQSAENALDHIMSQFGPDILLLDPPRTGAYSVLKKLLTTSFEKVIYVSCDPQTLARDLTLLIHGGYQLVSSQPFDMFPQTHHCESLTLLRKV